MPSEGIANRRCAATTAGTPSLRETAVGSTEHKRLRCTQPHVDDEGLPLWEAVWGAKLDQLVAFYDFADDDTYLPLIDHRNSIVGTWSTAERKVDALAEYSPHGRLKLYDADETPDCPAAGAAEEYCLDPTERPSGLPFGFVSAWQSPATGFVYMRNRWYSPRLAQFLSHDPLGYVDSYNLYAYVAFDPINGFDPWGLGKIDFQNMTFMDFASYSTYDLMPRSLECTVRDCSVHPETDEQLKRAAAIRKKRQAAGAAVAAVTAPIELLRKPSGDKPPAPLFDENHVPEREGAFWGGVLTFPVTIGVNAAAGAGIGRGLAKSTDDLASNADDVGDVAHGANGARGKPSVNSSSPNNPLRMPEKPSQLEHVFRDAPGHVNPSSAAGRKAWAEMFEAVASDGANLRRDAVDAGLITEGAAKAGVQAFTKDLANGDQVWVTVRDGVIQNAGVNAGGTMR